MAGHKSLNLPDEAFDRIASVFEEDKAQLSAAEINEEAVFAVCQFVAQNLGLKLKAPVRVQENISFISRVEAIAKASQIRMRRILLQGKWWEFDSGPLVAVQKQTGAPCALMPRKSGGYMMISPLHPEPREVTPELAQTLDAVGSSFYRPLPDKILSLKEVFSFALLNQWPDFARLFTVQAAISLIGLIIPIATGIIIETVIPTANFTSLGHFIIALIVITFATTTFKVAQVIASMRLKLKTNIAVQSAVWDRVLRLPLNFFRDFTAGDLATRVGGIDTIQQTLTGTALSAIIGGLFSMFTLALMFYYDSIIGLVALGMSIVGASISFFAVYIQLKYQRLLLKLRGKNANLVFQFINGISKLRAHARESRAFLRWSEKYAQIAKVFKRSQTIAIRMMVFQSLFTGVFLVIFFMMVMSRIDILSFGAFVALNAAVAQFNASFGALFGAIAEILKIVPLYERVQPILHTVPEIDHAGLEPGILDGEINLRNVCFYYRAGDPFVFADLNMHIGEGKFVAIVGPSGAGKSTFFRMLLGFETPQEGKIFYDGKNLATLNIRKIRQQLGVVLQTSTLMPGSILENILGANTSLTMDDAWQAAQMAAIAQDIQALPMGMHTLVSEEGRTFSMGQRQRLMIARALVRQPRILLLDEATSALDNATQDIVQNNLEHLKITRVVAAHRLSTIIHADCIYVFNAKGRIVQQGTYLELIKEKGMFADLVSAQVA